MVRIERDRRGGLRLFQGSALQGATPRSDARVLPQPDVEDTMDAATGRRRAAAVMAHSRPKRIGAEHEGYRTVMPIDPTAELLGRARPRKPRANGALCAATTAARRGAAQGQLRSAQRGAARKPRAPYE
jgi:hypothetical protein